MINLAYVALSVVAFVAIFKLGLILAWTKRLHERHGSRYGFCQIFGMMFAPQSESDLDPMFWRDLAPIQTRNLLSNIVLGCLAALVFSAAIGINHLLR